MAEHIPYICMSIRGCLKKGGNPIRKPPDLALFGYLMRKSLKGTQARLATCSAAAACGAVRHRYYVKMDEDEDGDDGEGRG
ncbi:hypothetical protein E4U40_000413 [Claviceps sp. LM458 group G5]|nr:hypothetical protein E4U40_000413 [Claviceps sp. LM458 group G5]